jgi:hypothetical protein
VTTDPEELDPEIDVELGGDEDLDEDLAEDLDGIPDGFVVEGADGEVEGADGDDDADDVIVAAPVVVVESAAEDADDFEDELSPAVRVAEDEEEAAGRQAGEFVCSRCFLVKRDSQLAVRSRKVCRDCA